MPTTPVRKPALRTPSPDCTARRRARHHSPPATARNTTPASTAPSASSERIAMSWTRTRAVVGGNKLARARAMRTPAGTHRRICRGRLTAPLNQKPPSPISSQDLQEPVRNPPGTAVVRTLSLPGGQKGAYEEQ